ncbi:tripartite tricarboxylate transporter substrate binding protein [Cupriavidus consociatus]|uniref:tripartite tricarboxylate transporter substrate binding protein n=1 Tax=Cupriavidus consociatus TaxID=2821357 RepID=UPI001AE751D2|nr:MULTISPECIES: tripartite tricarboxylate transporter substrate binding protein [unclassified Cupriavidus]MBP0623347.1 tripartite tricarboxylate transporter substrate binding protein [Cupriavidus sp. LEh25]MDK2660045.1 tripartite tricarboxylate transporter substrate binding protein [Cupriavidus sp. LEh21]
MKRYGEFRALTVVAALFLAPTLGHADEYPSRPITFIVPWQAGGPIDAAMRAVAQGASKRLGQPILIDNRPGVAGTLGPASMAATAKPDGYTIAQIGTAQFRMPLIQKTAYDPEKDFTYIVRLMGITFGVLTTAQSPYKSWGDVVEYAKKNPGKVTYASPGLYSNPHLGMEQITGLAGINLLHVPFKSTPESTIALLGGQTDLQVDGSGFRPLIESGKARLLAIFTEKRSPRWPDVPTLKELGYPLVVQSPIGIAGPKGMDPKIAAKLHDAFRAALADPEVQRVMDDVLMVPAYMGSKEWTQDLARAQKEDKLLLVRLGLLRADLK